MKFCGILFLLGLSFLFQCAKTENVNINADAAEQNQISAAQSESNAQTPQAKNPTDTKNMNEVFDYSGESEGVVYRFFGRLQKKGKYEGINYPKDNLIIEYSLKNTGSKNFIVYNRGHSDNANRAAIYVEPLAGGSIEISQKMFTEPAGKNCPDLDAPITPRGAWLKSGESIKEKVFVELPLEQKTPFDMCGDLTEIPEKPEKIKFCIGITEADVSRTTIDTNGIIRGIRKPSEQKLLCSREFFLP